MSYYVNFLGGLASNEFHIKWRFVTQGSWKNQNPGVRFGATSWTALSIQPILLDSLVIGPNWQCCFADSSKTAPRILIFFNCPGCRLFILCEIHSLVMSQSRNFPARAKPSYEGSEPSRAEPSWALQFSSWNRADNMYCKVSVTSIKGRY